MRLSRLLIALFLTVSSAASTTSLGAQAPRDSVACRALLSAATRDSQLLRISLTVRPLDTIAVRMSAAYRSLIGTGIVGFLKVPHPLALSTYAGALEIEGARKDEPLTSLTLSTTYRATLHRDGRISNVRVGGGTANGAFDAAMVRAIQMASDSAVFAPPGPPDVVFKGDSTVIHFRVAPDTATLGAQPIARTSKPGDTPILLVRLPLYRITQKASPAGSNRPPKYPDAARAALVEGKTIVDFVINGDGRPEMESIDFFRAPAIEFANEVLEVLPSHRFQPLMVEGCAVPVLVRQPFEFHLVP